MQTNNRDPVNDAAKTAAGEPFIDKAETARRLGKQTRTMDDWMKRGIIPFYKIGHSVAFRWSEVQEHLARTCKVSRRGR
jgi:excisionase family DNA binding protein